MTDKKWNSEAQAGVEEERRRLEQNGPSLERYRYPRTEIPVTDQKNETSKC
ncbi:hypothetical protein [Ruegeria arenilitoris]|uniref:hypothetical protein n=1 Tax=Ruegeria arenilitoris TaxID=1173585 RepID=UPI001C2C3446|nr:hypothetical protein [Ruegeria arenilitoris]